ncbi:MAG: citrate synthase [Myxococcales bacterium]|nr:citrate synthase [Myxococcales bacterium]
MTDEAALRIDDRSITLPVVTGTEGERAINIHDLRSETGLVTLDNGFANTASTKSAITFLDGEKGVLRYRGIPIEQLAENSSFVETSFLLIEGRLPTRTELKRYSTLLTRHSLLHEDMRHFFDGFPSSGHPMAILSSMVCSLSAYYPDSLDPDVNTDEHITRLLSKLRTIAAFSFQKRKGRPIMYPRNDLSYCANLLYMMFAIPAEPYEPDPEVVRALNAILILHADHEQNCSTSTVRLVGSSQANLYASISAGICALWGPLHGGANQAVIEMLEQIRDSGDDYKSFMDRVKDKSQGVRLMGFGHRVYKTHDPRARVLKNLADKLLPRLGGDDGLLDIALRLEEIALSDEYFISRHLYPNVDFYSGLLYRAMGIPTEMFTVMFAIGRLPGWIAHWREMHHDPDTRIGRPRQIYVGENERPYVPIDERG